MKLVALFLLCCAAAAAEQAPSPAQWREDLAFLSAKIVELHPDPFHRLGRSEFDAAINDVQQQLPSLSREESLVRLMQLVAMLGDGHTSVLPGALQRLGEHILPMRFYWYDDGLYLQAADRRYRDVLGKKLRAIGNTPSFRAA